MRHIQGPGPAELAPGLFLFPSSVWQMNSAVLCSHGEALVVDPGFFPDEIATLRDFVQGRGLRPRLYFTHGDFDHVAGHQAFPGAPRWGSPDLARREPGPVEDQVREFDLRYYVERPQPFTFPRLTWEAAGPEPGGYARQTLGALEVLFWPAPGHTTDGLAAAVPALGLLFAGDYLSDLEFPFVEDSLVRYRVTLSTFRKAVHDLGLRVLVPGHGPAASSQADILGRVERDEAYLETLWQAAGDSVREGLDEAEALARLEGVPYRGGPVPDHLRKAHGNNTRLVLAERRSLPG